MKDCRSTDGLREYGVHLVAQLCDMLEIDEYELMRVGIRDRKTGRKFYWSDWKPREGEEGAGDEI